MSGCRAYITYNQRVVLYANKSSPIWLFCILFFLFAFFLWQLGVCQCTANFSLQIFYLGNLEEVLLSPLSFQEQCARHSTSIQFTSLWGWFPFRFSKRRASNGRGQFCPTTCSTATPSCKGFTTADYLESLLPLQVVFLVTHQWSMNWRDSNHLFYAEWNSTVFVSYVDPLTRTEEVQM